MKDSRSLLLLQKGDQMKTQAELLGRQLTKALEVAAAASLATTEYFIPTRTIPLDDALVFVIKDLKHDKDIYVVTNAHLNGFDVWARIAEGDELTEINSGRWHW
jgi:hypothetical protein